MEARYPIFWTDFAEEKLDEIFSYYLEKANYKTAKSLILGIVKSTKFLESQPFLGQKEPHLLYRPEGIRYVLQGNYKILYSVFEERIMILDVFDTRMNPTKME